GHSALVRARQVVPGAVRPLAVPRAHRRPREVVEDRSAADAGIGAEAPGDGAVDGFRGDHRDDSGALLRRAGCGEAQLEGRLPDDSHGAGRHLGAELLPRDAAGAAFLVPAQVAPERWVPAVYGRPGPEPEADDPAGTEPRVAVHGGRDAVHPLGGARGDEPRLYPRGADEGHDPEQ